MGLYLNGYKVLEGSFIVATDGTALKPLADDTYYLGSTAYRFAGGYFGGNGIDVNPDSDVDADLITMSVTGNPKFWWDESEDAFAATKGLLVAGPIAVTAWQSAGSYTGNLLSLNATKTITDNSEYIANVISAYYAKTSAAYTGISIGTVSRAILDATNTQNWSAAEQRGGIVGLEGAVRIATGSAGTVTNATGILAKGEGEFLLGATVTNWRQILIENVTGAGVGNLVNLYGLYIQTITGASGLNYAIYSEGGQSYHAGNFQLGASKFFINETADTNLTIGLCMNQGTNDDAILTLKSSTDVAHPFTALVETDTYGTFGKAQAASGGIGLSGYKSSAGVAGAAVYLIGHLGEAADTTKTTAAVGVIQCSAYVTDAGTGRAAVGANGNLLVIDTADTARFIFDAEGSGHADVEWVAYDRYDDLALINDMEMVLLAREDEAKTYRRHALEQAGIIGQGSWHEEHGKLKAMVNFTKLSMLHHGALLQANAVLEQIEERLALQEQRVALLEGS